MKESKIESLSDQQLIRRKKFILFISGLSIGIALFSLILMIVQLASSKDAKVGGLVPGLILPIIVLPMYTGLKKINLELKKRQT